MPAAREFSWRPAPTRARSLSMLLFAQTLGDLTRLSGSWLESIEELGSHLWDGLLAIDRRTWLTIGGALLVVMFLTRRRKHY